MDTQIMPMHQLLYCLKNIAICSQDIQYKTIKICHLKELNKSIGKLTQILTKFEIKPDLFTISIIKGKYNGNENYNENLASIQLRNLKKKQLFFDL